MKEKIGQILRKVYLEDFARYCFSILRQIQRKVTGTDRKIIDQYFNNHNIKKLHIGCGSNILTGWLNSDYFPGSNQILHIDATEPFPFKNGDFDYIYSEHMIEHITYTQGLKMLSECYRVLKQNGKVIISTPDLLFLMELYRTDKSDLQKQYIKWAIETFIPGATCLKDTFVINNFVRDWGHKFIYDEKILYHALEKAGFTRISRCNLKDIDYKDLNCIENDKRMPPCFLELETMVLEGVRL